MRLFWGSIDFFELHMTVPYESLLSLARLTPDRAGVRGRTAFRLAGDVREGPYPLDPACATLPKSQPASGSCSTPNKHESVRCTFMHVQGAPFGGFRVAAVCGANHGPCLAGFREQVRRIWIDAGILAASCSKRAMQGTSIGRITIEAAATKKQVRMTLSCPQTLLLGEGQGSRNDHPQ